jgi:tRNA(Ile)-lysidine synthase
VRMWLTGVVGDGHPPSLAVVDRVLSVSRGEMPRADLVDGWRVARTAQRLRLERIDA